MATPPDDLDWFDAIAGRPRADADPQTLREATLLREAMRTWTPRALAADVTRADPEALVARARREGVLAGPRWCAGCAERWRWLRARPRVAGGFGFALAALLAVLVFGVLPPQRGDDESRVLRGTQADGVWLLRSAEPEALRERIAADLSATGLTVRRYERLGRFGIDAEGAAAPSPALQDTLRRHGVQPGADGVLRIEVEKAPP
jgi:hypothetical protein